MSTFKRGGIWWYKFNFKGTTFRESTGLTDREAAREKERTRHSDLRNRRAGTAVPADVPMFSRSADDYLKAHRRAWAPKTMVIERTNLMHLNPVFGKRLLSDITPADVNDYMDGRKAADKTISLEIGTLRGILLHADLDDAWRRIRKKITLKKARNIGRKLTYAEEAVLLQECRASRSRSLPVAVVLGIQTCMRSAELRLLQWRQVDLVGRIVTVGKSKTEAGEGRIIPLTGVAVRTLEMWADLFPARKPNHFVFPSEQYGHGGKVYGTDPMQPISTWKESWEGAKLRAGVECRFHDLRHTGCSRLLDAGVSHPIVAEIMGWSASTAIRMIKEVYGHIGLGAKQRAMELVEQAAGVGTEMGTIEGGENFRIQ